MTSKQITPEQMRNLAAMHAAEARRQSAMAQRSDPFTRKSYLDAAVDNRVTAYALLALAQHGHPITIRI